MTSKGATRLAHGPVKPPCWGPTGFPFCRYGKVAPMQMLTALHLAAALLASPSSGPSPGQSQFQRFLALVQAKKGDVNRLILVTISHFPD